jgi:hypothetical protein
VISIATTTGNVRPSVFAAPPPPPLPETCPRCGLTSGLYRDFDGEPTCLYDGWRTARVPSRQERASAERRTSQPRDWYVSKGRRQA